MEDCGGMAERLKAAVLKTAEARASVGSNPTPSARLGGGTPPPPARSPACVLARDPPRRSPSPVCARGWAKAGMVDDRRSGNPQRQVRNAERGPSSPKEPRGESRGVL